MDEDRAQCAESFASGSAVAMERNGVEDEIVCSSMVVETLELMSKEAFTEAHQGITPEDAKVILFYLLLFCL